MQTPLLFAAAIVAGALASAAGICATPEKTPQGYPTKPIRLIVPFPPGGGTDMLARVIATPVSVVLGESIVVDNRPGAGGAIAAELAARSDPDGYTLILVSGSYTATSAFRTPPYDPVRDIQPISLLGTTGLVMTVNPVVPAKSVQELIDYAKANPGKLNYASVGPGSVVHLSMELFKQLADVNLVHVPYKGAGPAFNALVAGETQVTIISLVPTIPHVKAGRLRAIGVTTSQRSPLLPDTPAIGETLPGFEVNHWYGVWGPKGMPKPIVQWWNREIAKVLHTDEMKKRLQVEGLEPAGGPPEQLQKVISHDVAKWRDVIKAAHIGNEG